MFFVGSLSERTEHKQTLQDSFTSSVGRSQNNQERRSRLG